MKIRINWFSRISHLLFLITVLVAWSFIPSAFGQREMTKTLDKPSITSIKNTQGKILDEIVLTKGARPMIIVVNGRNLHLVKKAQLFGKTRVGHKHVEVKIIEATPTQLTLSLKPVTTTFHGSGYYLQLQDSRENRLADVKTSRFRLQPGPKPIAAKSAPVKKSPARAVQSWRPSRAQARAVKNLSVSNQLQSDTRLQSQLFDQVKKLENAIHDNNRQLKSKEKGAMTQEEIDFIVADIGQIRAELSQTIKNLLKNIAADANPCESEKNDCFQKCSQLTDVEAGTMMWTQMKLLCELSCESAYAQCTMKEMAEQQKQSAKNAQISAKKAKLKNRASAQSTPSVAGPTRVNTAVSTQKATVKATTASRSLPEYTEAWIKYSTAIFNSIHTSATSIRAAMNALVESIANNLR